MAAIRCDRKQIISVMHRPSWHRVAPADILKLFQEPSRRGASAYDAALAAKERQNAYHAGAGREEMLSAAAYLQPWIIHAGTKFLTAQKVP
ncbi:hypothetical protein ACVOMV_26650 (plasmid) [Mesorhizobium atlanticum]|uniref:hypothetical protein n=1 Tax=Mesorhizobium atlanticum TaxID=2233532 RepID=UPI0037039836